MSDRRQPSYEELNKQNRKLIRENQSLLKRIDDCETLIGKIMKVLEDLSREKK